ncbi:histone-lysine N-methyltransferase ATXR2 [Ananas comosus]|uniref:Histone-lysine N-methyltransferase ATXR2 n=1 Tax=Ananas comosus TaxID=4615 RepID=A0A6P5G115_ANACO|nr:histone-lysine N-methyltransferase ATXR2 [Ananas comosus]
MDRNSPCPLDKEYSDHISALLSPPPPPQSVQEYYDEVIEATKCTGVRVSCSSRHGKGVYANRDFTKDELILKDQILVGAQHSSNKVDCLVCSYCYRFIGSIELQIGRRLYLQSLGLSTSKHCHDDTGSSSSINMNENSPPEEVLKSLINGNLSLPYTSQFALPPVIACPGGCEEEHYCSQFCAESDWTSYHSLLCTGSNTGESRRSALLKFIDHANGTNDIFLVAAKAISFTILRYKKLKSLQGVENEQHPTPDNSNKSDFSLLLEAWKPVSMGFKKRWWDCIALPDDVDTCDEASFRMEIQDLAFISLQLLKDAIFDIECAPLFSLEVYGNIIGMFELNNLDLVVASPVEDYFIYIDDLSQREKEEAERVTQPFLEALGDEYSVSCQGTAFFPIQSCMNHSCCPNANAFKRDEDKDGHATIIARQPISEGEEITISYIDEDLPYEERQALLADYGFSCMCPRCLKEQPK